jgi:hypothetical protein
MNIEKLMQFRDLLIENKKLVSKLEYTKNNYDHQGNLIKEKLPTITTDFCEIGLFKNQIYFVVIIDSVTFNPELFDKIKIIPNMKIYGFNNFKTDLYPVEDFGYQKFIDQIQKEKLLQVEFDYHEISIIDLYTEYLKLIDIFVQNKIKVINQFNNHLY